MTIRDIDSDTDSDTDSESVSGEEIQWRQELVNTIVQSDDVMEVRSDILRLSSNFDDLHADARIAKIVTDFSFHAWALKQVIGDKRLDHELLTKLLALLTAQIKHYSKVVEHKDILQCCNKLSAMINSYYDHNANECVYDANSESDVESKANSESDVESKANSELDVEVNANSELDVESNAKSRLEFESNANSELDVELNANSESDVESNANSELDVESNAKSRLDFESNANSELDFELNANSESDVESNANSESDVESNANSELDAEPNKDAAIEVLLLQAQLFIAACVWRCPTLWPSINHNHILLPNLLYLFESNEVQRGSNYDKNGMRCLIAFETYLHSYKAIGLALYPLSIIFSCIFQCFGLLLNSNSKQIQYAALRFIQYALNISNMDGVFRKELHRMLCEGHIMNVLHFLNGPEEYSELCIHALEIIASFCRQHEWKETSMRTGFLTFMPGLLSSNDFKVVDRTLSTLARYCEVSKEHYYKSDFILDSLIPQPGLLPALFYHMNSSDFYCHLMTLNIVDSLFSLVAYNKRHIEHFANKAVFKHCIDCFANLTVDDAPNEECYMRNYDIMLNILCMVHNLCSMLKGTAPKRWFIELGLIDKLQLQLDYLDGFTGEDSDRSTPTAEQEQVWFIWDEIQTVRDGFKTVLEKLSETS